MMPRRRPHASADGLPRRYVPTEYRHLRPIPGQRYVDVRAARLVVAGWEGVHIDDCPPALLLSLLRHPLITEPERSLIGYYLNRQYDTPFRLCRPDNITTARNRP